MFQKILQKYPGMAQFARFVVVGFLNTGVDFFVLNILMWVTGIYQGKWIFFLNTISFSVAVTNSYFWNKYWTFKAKGEVWAPRQISQFIFVTIIGAGINSGIVYFLTTFFPPFFGIPKIYGISQIFGFSLGKELWANVAKAAATAISLFWNFLGYKFIVFKK